MLLAFDKSFLLSGILFLGALPLLVFFRAAPAKRPAVSLSEAAES
jgi:hypothetical protein